MRTLRQLMKHLGDEHGRRPHVLPFFCMVDRRKAMHREIVDGSGDDRSAFLSGVIPYSSTVESMGLHREPLARYAPHADATRAYEALWRETLNRTGSWLGGLDG